MDLKINKVLSNTVYKYANNQKQRTKNFGTIDSFVLPSCMPKNYYTDSIAFCANYRKMDDVTIQYDEEEIPKEDKSFVNQIALEKQGHEANIPNSILVFAPLKADKTDFVNKIVNETECRAFKISGEFNNFCLNTRDSLNKSRQNYINNGQRSIIIVDDAELYLNDARENRRNIAMMKGVLDDCAQKPNNQSKNASAATFIFTTSRPLEISDEILSKPDFKNSAVIIKPLEGEKIKDLIKSCIANFDPAKNIIDFDKYEFSKTVEKLNPDTEQGAYGNDRLKSIVMSALEDYKNDSSKDFEELIIKQADKTPRNIFPNKLYRFQDDLISLASRGLLPSIKLTPECSKGLDIIQENLEQADSVPYENNTLDELEDENNFAIDILSQNEVSKISDIIKDVKIEDMSLIDYWINLEEGLNASSNYTSRLKNLRLNEILQNPDKTNELIGLTLDKLQEDNDLIKTARKSYLDILENEDELTQNQKQILIQEQENALFFRIVTNKLNPDDIIKIEQKTIGVLRQLSKENDTIIQNAKNNIFSKCQNSSVLLSDNPDDKENVEFILDLLAQKAKNVTGDKKEELQNKLSRFYGAIQDGDEKEFNNIWDVLLNDAIDYFNNEKIKELTDKNIELLYSIQKNSSDDDSPVIKNALNNKNLTIEQREFISRYKDDKNLQLVLKNSNVDKSSVLEDLVLYEAQNRNIITEANLDISDDEFNKMMSDKFHQINSENKDINIQGDKIVSKLNEINSSINSQSDLINQFADKFSNYALSSLTLQNAQLNELIEISNNTQEIKQYTQALTRAKLVELEKDKNYKDIVPEITKLLPDNEQIDIQDFLLKIDELAENEKNAARKKKILKIGSLIAGGAAAGGALYYFGPQIVAHLLSNSTANLSGVITKAIMDSNTARMLGNGSLISKFPFKGVYEDTARQIRNIEYEIEQAKKHLKLHPDDKLTAEKLDNLIKKLGNSKDKLKKLTS